MHFSWEEALPGSQGSNQPSRDWQERAPGAGDRGQPGSWHGTRGATHLSVKSSSRGGGCRVGEGGMGDGGGQLRGVERVGSPRFWGGWDKSRSSQVI